MNRTLAWKSFKVALLGAGIVVATVTWVTAGLVVVALFEINDQIDRCADDGSDKYIRDERERERVCAPERR